MRGYWRDPEGTAKRFHAGPLPGERVCHTGDLFREDEQGYFYFVGRRDDMLKVLGRKVAPKVIEDVLYSAKGVVEAAVLGVPHPVLGQSLKAVVGVGASPVTELELLAHCRAHLERHLVPTEIEIRDRLPRTASGKVLRAALS